MQEKCVFYPGVKFQGDIPNFVPLRGLQSAGSPVTQSSPNAKTGIWILRAFLKEWPPTKVQNGIFQTIASD